ncbi:MAG: chemotaxis protein CheW [Pseudomonadota bacterium]
MNEKQAFLNSLPATAAPAEINDCWNRIGVRGDGSCPELRQHLHCRNCPAYATAAAILLDRMAPADEPDAVHVSAARTGQLQDADAESLLIFRVGEEWLGLRTALLREIAEARTIHSLPHQRNAAVLGVANVRGALTLCVSLATMLGLDEAAEGRAEHEHVFSSRMLVADHMGHVAVFPVAEVHGIQRFPAAALKAVPVTVAGAAATYTQSIVNWRDRTVGVLDGELLFYALNRSLA